MKVCIIVNEYPPDRIAGTAMATRSLAEFLREKGTDVHVIVTERASASPGLSEDKGIIIHRLRHGKIPVFRWLLRICRIRRIVKQIRPDIIHAQSLSCGFYGMIACFLHPVPLMLSIQGQDMYQASRFQRKTEVRWPILFADCVTAVTKQLAKQAEQISGRKDIQTVPHGFRVCPHTAGREKVRKKFGLCPDDFVIVCVARLSHVKGADILLRSVISLPDAVLWIIGDGEERENLEKIVRKNGLSGRVTFLGIMENHLVQNYLAAADLFVLSSRSEAFGISLLEAMNAGLPVIASQVGGIPEIISPENGILVPPENPRILAEAIRMLISSPDLRKKMQDANREKAGKYQWEVIGESYLGIYLELIEKRKHR